MNMIETPYQIRAYDEKGKGMDDVTVVGSFPLLANDGEDSEEHGYIVETAWGLRRIMIQGRLVKKSSFDTLVSFCEDALVQMKEAIAWVAEKDVGARDEIKQAWSRMGRPKG